MFVRIYAKSTDHLKDILHGKVQKVDGIERTENLCDIRRNIKPQYRVVSIVARLFFNYWFLNQIYKKDVLKPFIKFLGCTFVFEIILNKI